MIDIWSAHHMAFAVFHQGVIMLQELLTKELTIKYTITGGNKVEKAQLTNAIDYMNTVINTLSFRQKILNNTIKRNGKVLRGFEQTNESTTKILERFVQGNERGTGIDYEMDLDLHFYITRWGKAIAYTNRGSLEINLNRKYFTHRDISSIANTLTHEYCHLVGMVHSYRNPGWKIWNNTAPYKIGILVEEEILSLLGEPPIRYSKPSKPSIWRRIKNYFWRQFRH